MPKPLFNATEFTGSFLFVQLSFPNVYLLSESTLDKIDTVSLDDTDSVKNQRLLKLIEKEE